VRVWVREVDFNRTVASLAAARIAGRSFNSVLCGSFIDFRSLSSRSLSAFGVCRGITFDLHRFQVTEGITVDLRIPFVVTVLTGTLVLTGIFIVLTGNTSRRLSFQLHLLLLLHTRRCRCSWRSFALFPLVPTKPTFYAVDIDS
jgi:hypothetical protein